MKRSVWLWTRRMLLCSLLIVPTGCMNASAKQREPELLKPVKRQLDLYEVKRGTIEREVKGIGTFVPVSSSFLHLTVSGKIAALHVKQGDRVQKGDVLIELDTGDLPMKIAEQKLALAKAEQQLDEARQTRDADKIRLAALGVQVEQMKLEALESDLKKRKLIADRSGVVTFIDFLKPGDIAPAYRDIIGIADDSELVFRYTSEQDQADMYAVEVGTDAEIRFNGSTYAGKVKQTPLTAPLSRHSVMDDLNAKSLIVQLERQPPDATIGDMGELRVVTDRRENALVIPRVGLRTYQGRNYVLLKDGDSRKEVDVEKGLETAIEVEIKKGLEEGQTIILNR